MPLPLARRDETSEVRRLMRLLGEAAAGDREPLEAIREVSMRHHVGPDTWRIRVRFMLSSSEPFAGTTAVVESLLRVAASAPALVNQLAGSPDVHDEITTPDDLLAIAPSPRRGARSDVRAADALLIGCRARAVRRRPIEKRRAVQGAVRALPRRDHAAPAAGRRGGAGHDLRKGRPAGLLDELEIHAERLVDGPRPGIRGNERPSVLPRSSTHERVVHGTAGDAQPDKLDAELACLRLTEKLGCGEVVGKQTGGMGR